MKHWEWSHCVWGDDHTNSERSAVSIGSNPHVIYPLIYWSTNHLHEFTAQRHYRTAAKSLPEDRHTIPLLVFEDASVSNMVLNMAEQVMIVAFKS